VGGDFAGPAKDTSNPRIGMDGIEDLWQLSNSSAFGGPLLPSQRIISGSLEGAKA